MSTLRLGSLQDTSSELVVEFATRLPNLQKLICDSWTDGDITLFSKHLTGLVSLDLGHCNELTDTGIEAVVEHLTGLTSLSINFHRVTDAGVRSVAERLKRLSSLVFISHDAIASSLLGFGSDENDVLTVTDVGVRAVAERLSGLTSLKLMGCQKLTDVGVRAVAERLSGLTSLAITYCENVTDASVEAVVGGLSKLQELDLEACRSVTEQGFRFLASAVLNGSMNLQRLSLPGTRCGLPDEVIKTRNANIIARSLISKAALFSEAKLLLLGDGRVGKSHLKDRLCGGRMAFDANKSQTHDIDMTVWESTADRPRTRLWDFGGQQSLHGAHRFFLGADHTAYVLVLDAIRSPAANHLNYWLRFIAHHGRSQRAGERAPVVIVVNKCDVIALAKNDGIRAMWPEAESVLRIHEELTDGLSAAQDAHWHGANVIGSPIFGLGLFPRNRHKYETDKWLGTLPRPVEIPDELYEDIWDAHVDALGAVDSAITTALKAVPVPHAGYPPEFHRLREYVASEFGATDPPVPWISVPTRGRGTELPAQLGVRNEDLAVWLKTLSDIGLALWLGDLEAVERGEYPTVRDRVFNPRWAKGPAYCLIQTPHGEHCKGRLTKQTLAKRLTAYSLTEQDAALELILACRIGFRVRDQRTHDYTSDRLIPDLLDPLSKTGTCLGAGGLRWRLEVPFLSDRVLLRFIGDFYDYVETPQTECWRNRVTFHWPAKPLCRVCVTSELEGSATECPHLLLEITGGDERAREDVAEAVRLELARILCSEGLLNSPNELLPIDENGAATFEDWLRRLLEDTESGEWITESKAIDLHKEKSRAKREGVSKSTFGDYRKESRGGIKLFGGDGGVDKNGYVWRRKGRNYEYLASSVRKPVTPP